MRVLLFLPLTAFSLSVAVSNPEKVFPDRAIDFVLETKSFVETPNGKAYLRRYSIAKVGKNYYRLNLHFEAPAKVKRRKIASGIYINIVEREAIKLNLNSYFWYRGGRLLAFKTQRGFKIFDLTPKCFLVSEKGKLIPEYNSGDVVFNLNGHRVHLWLTFTGCEF